MPELPEVHTTATILDSLIVGHKIIDVWTEYKSAYHFGKENIKDPKYFKKFKETLMGQKITRVYRRAKNVLIETADGKTILIHMKMTGHLLFGKYIYSVDSGNKSSKNRKGLKNATSPWKPVDSNSPLADPFNRFIRLVFTLQNKKGGEIHLAFSDMRKFATVSIIEDKERLAVKFKKIGHEPLDGNYSWQQMKKDLLKRPGQKIKTALMDQELVAGIGNIYSDEILWETKIHPETSVEKISDDDWKKIFKATRSLLSKGIDFGGDSMSDYRNPYGLPGNFQKHHSAYRRAGQKCLRKGCGGKIIRKLVEQRSAHYCEKCQSILVS